MHFEEYSRGTVTSCPSFQSHFPATELEATLAFTLAPTLSNAKARALIEHFGDPISAYKACAKEMELPFPLPQNTLSYFTSGKGASLCKAEIEIAERLQTKLLPFFSPEFPKKLHLLSDCPLLLYVKGTLPAENQPCLAIVGTRNATEYGKETSFAFAKSLALNGFCIVSGLARGIDTAAHKGSLLTGTTLAIIGSGIGHIYPKENEALAEEIAKKGAVISELPMQMAPSRYSFPKRNRLISAFSDALLVAEAPLKSGSMITMEIGRAQSKLLFALPGRALSDLYEGNHFLIRNGATLAHHPDQIAKALGLHVQPKQIERQQKKEPHEQKILDLLSQSELSLDELSCNTTLPIPHLQATLIQLLLKNLVKELPGKRYKIHE